MYLYGASGHAKVIVDILESQRIRVDALIDDNESIETLAGYPVRHDVNGCSPLIVSIGNNKIRKEIVERLHGSFGTAIHPSAIVSPKAHIGEGSVVMQGAIVQTEAMIGTHCIINTGASVDHECKIGDFVHVSPHATLCGNVEIGEGTWIGAGTTVIQGVSIGKWCVIGAGSVVSKDIPDNCLAVGNRCKIIKKYRKE